MCVSPLKGFKIGLTDKGKDLFLITSYNCHHIEYSFNRYVRCYNSFVSPIASRVVTRSIDIPCGRCVECRLNYSRVWANRLMLEAQEHDYNYFLTLTYNDINCPVYSDGVMTLCKKDLQDFLKRLRRRIEPFKIRYFACGEYGDRTFRPHYHMIVFGLEIPDLELYSVNRGNALYTSDWLNDIWGNGFVTVGQCDWQSCAYTARYVMKKLRDVSDRCDELGIAPEFLVMSRRPGIGRLYFEKNADKIYETDELILSSKDGGIRSKPPRYFDTLYEIKNPVHFALIKARRKIVQESLKRNLLLQTNLSYDKILENRGYNLEQKIKVLKRDLL